MMVSPDGLPDQGQFFEVGIGVLGLVLIIFIHGTGLRMVNLSFNRSLASLSPMSRHIRTDLILARVIASLATIHLLETLVVSAPIWLSGIIPNLRDSYYFVLGCYTTIGSGDVTIPDKWRLFGPIIAMGGLFTFGWTGSVLVSIMTSLGRFDSDRASGVGHDRPR